MCTNACRNLLCVLSIVLLPGAAAEALAQNADAVEKGLVGFWKLDETSGTTAADSSEKGHKGTLQDDLKFDNCSVGGRIGKAIQLDGKRGYLAVAGYKGITGTKVRTVAAWIKTAQRRGDVIRWGADDAGRIFRIGFIRGRLGLDPSGGYLYINEDLTDDKWHHFAAVVHEGDPPTLHDHVKLYVDGEPADIHDIGLLALWPLDTGDELDLTIGRGFDGLIDEVRLYDRDLSAEEIRTLFKAK